MRRRTLRMGAGRCAPGTHRSGRDQLKLIRIAPATSKAIGGFRLYALKGTFGTSSQPDTRRTSNPDHQVAQPAIG
jgi:hypothetical protein